MYSLHGDTMMKNFRDKYKELKDEGSRKRVADVKTDKICLVAVEGIYITMV